MMRKFFGKKKDDDEDEATEEEVAETPTDETTTEVTEESVDDEIAEEAEEASETGIAITMPYHATLQDRLRYLLTDTVLSSSIEAPDEWKIELMAMGERFMVCKKPMGEVEIASGAAPDEDVFIRIGNDVVSELLSAATFSEFSAIFLKYYKNAEPGKFVKIELRKPITDLNRRGYARVPTLKLLIGAAR
ncbi:MAG: hypothetical protein P1Q69_12695 [Candidatus Thorarchaeota archaeon]|nr:hypothetical protein [Candidatus Thorarchaeota archaeon]